MTSSSSDADIGQSSSSIISKLQSCAGITISRTWMIAFQTHLQSQNKNPNDENTILLQILHSDLREVINDHDDSAPQLQSDHSDSMKILRKCLEASMTGSFHSTIPPLSSSSALNDQSSPFRLMVQVEELLDVSMNAETRYAHGPAPQTAPSPVGQQKNRCLKLLISDGSVDNVKPMVALEIKPIPNLSTNSEAGIKLLLRPPISIRYGVLLLHEGNAEVLGGCIPSLIDTQKKAMERAEKNSMVNVDPTIRALINQDANFTFGEDDEENDEREASSSDVLPTNSPAITATNLSTNFSSTTSRTAINTNIQPVNTSNESNANANDNTNTNTNANNDITENNILMQATSRPLTRDQDTIRHQSLRKPSTMNTTIDASTNKSTHSSLYQNGQIQKGDKVINPYAKPLEQESRSISASLQTNSTQPRSVTFTDVSQSNNTRNITANPYATPKVKRLNKTTPGSGLKTSPLDLITPPDNCSPHPNSNPAINKTPPPHTPSSLPMSPTALTTPVSFDELLHYMSQSILSISTYKTFEEKIFIVPSKMIGAHKDFNIIKDPNRQKSKKEKKDKKPHRKYNYTMTCNWIGPISSSSKSSDASTTESSTALSRPLITCKLSNSLLEPYFALSADDMRKLNRTNKEKSQKLVQEGGCKVVADVTSGYQNFAMKFLHTCDEWEALSDNEKKDGIWMMILRKCP